MRKLAFAVAAVLFAGAGWAHAQGFTLEQVMSGGFSSELHASPKGNKITWIENSKGRRNLWIADLSGSKISPKQVTPYDKDDGQDLGDVAWLPDGSAVVYVRGGDFEFPGREFPNPAQLTEGVDQVMWIVGMDAKPRKLAEGRSPAVSPDGKSIAYIGKGGLWSMPLTGDAKPALMFHARGDEDAPTWSPDGKMLAFVSHRGDHSFIGVYTLATKELTYIDPGTTRDQSPAWSADSKSIAFIRVPPPTSSLFKIQRTAEPWSIRIADVATGVGHDLWHAPKGPGSAFHGLATEQQLFWTAGGSIIFPWEGDGWCHLYAVSASGGDAKLLTPGAFEVEHADFNEERTKIALSSNQNDIDRRHIWVVDTASAMPTLTQASSGDSIEVFPVVLSDGRLAALHSTATMPVHPALIVNGATKDIAPQLVPAEFPAARLVKPQQVFVTAADGMVIHGQLFLPPGDTDGITGKHKAVVFFHGGSRREMLLGFHYMDYYANAYAMNQFLASQGYVVLSVNYRSGIGYGLNFREALNYGAAGASEYNDVMGAGLFLKQRADVDPAKIGAWGGSYGGFLTAMALARSSDLFAAGVDFHGVHDWTDSARNFIASQNPADDPGAAKLAWESSPLASIKTWKSPVLLIQGDDDRNVRFSNTVRLAAALREQGVPFEEHVFPDEIHGFLLYKSWHTAYELTADFLTRKLDAAK